MKQDEAVSEVSIRTQMAKARQFLYDAASAAVSYDYAATGRSSRSGVSYKAEHRESTYIFLKFTA